MVLRDINMYTHSCQDQETVCGLRLEEMCAVDIVTSWTLSTMQLS